MHTRVDLPPLGYISATEESGGRGIDAISSGVDDPGGVSYGPHQLSSKSGTMAAYLRSSKFKDDFDGLQPGTPEFNDQYAQVAKMFPREFAEDQRQYIERTHYVPLRRYASREGVPDNRAINEALYSMGVQHGGARRIVDMALAKYDGNDPSKLINALYDARRDYVKKLHLKTEPSLMNRYDRELKAVLALLEPNIQK